MFKQVVSPSKFHSQLNSSVPLPLDKIANAIATERVDFFSIITNQKSLILVWIVARQMGQSSRSSPHSQQVFRVKIQNETKGRIKSVSLPLKTALNSIIQKHACTYLMPTAKCHIFRVGETNWANLQLTMFPEKYCLN